MGEEEKFKKLIIFIIFLFLFLKINYYSKPFYQTYVYISWLNFHSKALFKLTFDKSGILF